MRLLSIVKIISLKIKSCLVRTVAGRTAVMIPHSLTFSH